MRYETGIESAIPIRASLAVAVGKVAIVDMSKSHSDSCRGTRFFEALIIVPAVYLALHQHPSARSLSLLALGRTRGCTLARAIEGDRYIRRQNGPKVARPSTSVFSGLRATATNGPDAIPHARNLAAIHTPP